MSRSAMLEVLGLDYVQTARAKGLDEWLVIVKHALKNAAIPIVTVIGCKFVCSWGGSGDRDVLRHPRHWASDLPGYPAAPTSLWYRRV